MKPLLPLAALAVLAGCTPPAWRLRADALVPPGVPPKRTTANVKAPGSCTPPAAEHGLSARREGGQLSIRVDASQLKSAPAGALTRWLAGLDCGVDAGRVAYAVPLPSAAAHRVMHSPVAATGHLDLRPGYRLRVTSPITRNNAPVALETARADAATRTIEVRANAELLGYEVAWFTVTPNGVTATGAEAHVEGRLEKAAASRFRHFEFPAGAAHLRLLVLTRQSSADRDSLVLAAASARELEEQTRRLDQDPGQCQPPRCVILPKQVALTAFIAVTVNGEEKLLAPGATVREATGGRPVRALWKPWAGSLRPVQLLGGDPLTLPLEGGERILQ